MRRMSGIGVKLLPDAATNFVSVVRGLVGGFSEGEPYQEQGRPTDEK